MTRRLLMGLFFLLPVLASTLLVECNGRIEINYTMDEALRSLEMPQDLEVARVFVAYLKLPSNLKFFNPGVSASLRSLSDALRDYELRLETVKKILEERNVNLQVEEIGEDVNIASRLAKTISEGIDATYADLKRFASKPRCGYRPDLRPVEKMEDLAELLSSILSRVEHVRLKLSDVNMPATELAALQSLLNPPYTRHEIDTLVASARTDREVLEGVFNPSKETLLDILELAEKTRNRNELKNILERMIETRLGNFTLEEAKNFIVKNADRLRRREKIDYFLKLYGRMEELLEKKDYGAAVVVAQKLVRLAKFILEGGYVEERGPDIFPLVLLILIALVLIFFWRRRKNEEGADVPLDI